MSGSEKKVGIHRSWIGKELVVELGPAGDMDRTYVNGKLIGGIMEPGFWMQPRVYTVPEELAKDSVLTIAVRVLGIGGGDRSGMWGNNVMMKVHLRDSDENISLAGDWKYLPVAELISDKFYLYKIEGEEFNSRPKTSIDISPYTPTMLYNGMIAP